jgi:hypothetical protein
VRGLSEGGLLAGKRVGVKDSMAVAGILSEDTTASSGTDKPGNEYDGVDRRGVTC